MRKFKQNSHTSYLSATSPMFGALVRNFAIMFCQS